MHLPTILTFATMASATPISFSDPFDLLPRQGTGTGADSCPSDPLNAKTWTDLDLDTFLKDWSAANVTATQTNNVQALADSFGAPNFFCGLDNFCNAGQPCLPVTLPAWYVLVAIQNWNSFMNSMNTAISFASAINSLILPGIVKDFYPSPEDNVTPLKTFVSAFTTILGVVPLTGAVSTASGLVSSTISFIDGNINPPEAADKFVAWSDLATSLSSVLQDYQAAVSNSMKATLDAKVGAAGGINEKLAKGAFLGVSQNFTQSDLQAVVTDSITVRAIGLVFQAQNYYLTTHLLKGATCDDSGSTSALCTPSRVFQLGRQDGDNTISADKEVNLLVDKYKMTRDQILAGPARCFFANGGKQLQDGFGDVLPLDPGTDCLFNVQVCDEDQNPKCLTGRTGAVECCREIGLNLP